MFRKLLCWLGSHIWVVSQEEIHASVMTDPITVTKQKCLFCKKEKKIFY